MLRPTPVRFTWWGGILGPRILNHVKCNGCGFSYNGKTGHPNTQGILVYSVVMGVVGIIILAAITLAR